MSGNVDYDKHGEWFKWKAESKPQEPLSSFQKVFFLMLNYDMTLKFEAGEGNWKIFIRETRCESSAFLGFLGLF